MLWPSPEPPSSVQIILPPTMAAQPQQPQVWRAWSIPIQLSPIRQKLCGLLNKLTKANFNSISHQISLLAVSVERTGDPQVLDSFVRTIFQHSKSDAIHTRLFVDLCQRIVDELEGERTQWRKVDLFHLGNPMDCFETSLRLRSQYEFDRILTAEESEVLYAFVMFAGELLAEGLLFPDDVINMVDLLFGHAMHNSEEHTTALYRFVSRVSEAFNASQLLASLDVVGRVEMVLRENGLSTKARYTMMNILDQVLYPQPHDAFSSARHRTEVYGLDVTDSETSSTADSEGSNDAVILQACQEQARIFLSTRKETAALQFFGNLKPAQRQWFAFSLVSTALASGDLSDAQLVASLFSLRRTRDMCSVNTFARGFEPVLSVLEDTTIDVPHAGRLLAIMLQASPLPLSTVEELTAATARGTGDDTAIDRLLDTYTTLVQSPGSRSGFTSSAASVEHLQRSRSQEGDSRGVLFGYAY